MADLAGANTNSGSANGMPHCKEVYQHVKRIQIASGIQLHSTENQAVCQSASATMTIRQLAAQQAIANGSQGCANLISS